jgi:hypothetical protein
MARTSCSFILINVLVLLFVDEVGSDDNMLQTQRGHLPPKCNSSVALSPTAIFEACSSDLIFLAFPNSDASALKTFFIVTHSI